MWRILAEKMRSNTSLQRLFVVLLILFVTCESFPRDEVRALTAFKEAIYEDPLLVLSNWNTLDADPCEWNGVFCSFARDHVVRINITNSSIRGFLPPELGRITYLRELILHGNKLIGSIPKELGMLKSLKVLDLGVNQLTGPIPPEIANINGVMRIGRLPYCKDRGCLVEWAKEFLELPEVTCCLVDPELKHFAYEDLQILCEVISLCIHPEPTKRPSMEEVCSMLESKIDTSVSLEFKSSSLAWAELALSS